VAQAGVAGRPMKHLRLPWPFAECHWEATVSTLVGGDLVVAAAQILDERVTGGEYP
jgi:hypothetical protein